jgi:uncharacterized protein (DUF885 family)
MTDPAGPAQSFRHVAERVLDAVLELGPEDATFLGDHRFDDRLSDLGAAGTAHRLAVLGDALSALDQVDDGELDEADKVDLELLRTTVAREQWTFGELRPHEHDPLLHLPGDALYGLLARDVGDPAERLRALVARLGAVPAHLETARSVLHDMPRVHVETAVGQARGVLSLLGEDVDALAARVTGGAALAAGPRAAAAEAVEDFVGWLEAALPEADGEPRLGEQSFAAKLWYALDTYTTPDSLLTRAESDLQAIEEEICELACTVSGRSARPGLVREVLDRLAADAPVDDATILPLCEQALARTTARVRELDLVTVPDDPVQIIVMPESRRGVAVAYCDPPGPLEPPGPGGALATFFAVSPTPADWDAARVDSFYREYNGHMVRNLTVHEAMPGHVLQLAHAARGATSRVRAASMSGPFVEGWAVYAEELMAERGLGLGEDVDLALRMQRLKMQLRSTINAVLDVRVHARGMTQDEAMRLMTERGHQEEGEAAGKWRRALLTSTQLSTYYVGYHAVRDVVARLRAATPGATDREIHDAVLAHGSPPPRHLETLLAL